eukprot:m.27077 g.27077  ORF g.27077 m.27077 type:complete len:61 (+) comp9318_c0_seq3:561-743(+)
MRQPLSTTSGLKTHFGTNKRIRKKAVTKTNECVKRLFLYNETIMYKWHNQEVARPQTGWE